MQKGIFRSQTPTEILLSFTVLGLLLAYTYASLVKAPYAGFYFNPYDGQILEIYVDAESSVTLQKGDVLEQVDSIPWDRYQADTNLVLFERVLPDQRVDITIRRNGSSLMIPWYFPGFNSREFIARFINTWWLAFIFWFFGMAVQLFVRPRDVRWRLFIAANYLTGLWLIFGNLSSLRVWGSSVLFHATTWLALPVYLQLHWIFPKPLGRMPQQGWLILYLISFLLAMGEILQILPRSLYALGFLLTLLGSIALLVIHFIRQPDHRREVRQLALAILIALIPSIVLSIVGLFGNVSQASPVALVFLPIMPGAYFFIAYRRQLGGLELRANRIISIYLFLVVVSILLLVLIPPITLLLIPPEAVAVVAMTIAVFTACIGILVFPRFQAFVDQRLLGIKLPYQNLQEMYSERITTSSSLEDLLQLLREELIPSLFIRQFVFIHLFDGSSRMLLALGITDDQLPKQDHIDDLIKQMETHRFYLFSNQYPVHPWLQLGLPLRVGENLIGLWLLGRRDPDDTYFQTEIPILQSLANQTAVALSNILHAERLKSMYEANIDRYEQERLRLSRDLHDSILNEMGALLMRSDAPIFSPEFQQAFEALAERLREIVSNLRPPTLNFGLKFALEDMAESFSERIQNGVKIDPDIQADKEWRYPELVENHSYRIVQEACENALKYAHAKTIRITARLQPEAFDINVEDDGMGFNAEASLKLDEMLANKHFGLAGMYERANLIGAEMSIRSQPNQGTRIQVVWKSKESI